MAESTAIGPEKSVAVRLTLSGKSATGGQVAYFLSVIFAIGSLACVLMAETQWANVPINVGIGTSGYILVLYTRALTLAVLSAAFAAMAIFAKNRDSIIASWSPVETPSEEVVQTGDDPRGGRPGPFGRRHN